MGAQIGERERTGQRIYFELLSMNQSPSESARWTINMSTERAEQWWCGRLGEEVIGNIAQNKRVVCAAERDPPEARSLNVTHPPYELCNRCIICIAKHHTHTTRCLCRHPSPQIHWERYINLTSPPQPHGKGPRCKSQFERNTDLGCQYYCIF